MKVARIYKETDQDMQAQVGSVLYFFRKHLSDFTAYDAVFDAAYLADFTEALHDLGRYGLGTDPETVVLEDRLLTADSQETLARCRAKYADVKYYAGKAFPGNKEALKEFGEGAYSRLRGSRLAMVQFMETLHGVALKYKAELIAQNYTQPAIDEIATLAQELRTDNNAQQLKKKERHTETRKRIEALNRFYTFGKQVAEAARVIYRNNESLRAEFRLLHRHQPKVKKHWLRLAATGRRKLILPQLLKKYTATLTNQSRETISYWQADKGSENPVQKFNLAAGEVVPLTARVPAAKFLVLQNTSGKPVRLLLTKEVRT